MKNNEYDAIIIGAGIGGLVCGCYLAKAGMKVLIVEKNAKPGGYCTSFTSHGFKFDACVHFLGSLRQNGIVKKVMNDLDLENKIEIRRQDPSDIIISQEYTFSFWNKPEKTIAQLSEYFPREKKSIEKFFHYISKIESYGFLKLRNLTLLNILDGYFTDSRLKSLIGFPILGNASLPPSKVSAIKAMTLYKEFMLDGGYYLPGGVHILPEALLEQFKKYNGSISFNNPALKILVENKKAYGVKTKQKDVIRARYVISNADAYHTFFDLVGNENMPRNLMTLLHKMEPSLSMFTLYLGLKNVDLTFPAHANVWYLKEYNLEKLYQYVCDGSFKDVKYFFVYYNPERRTILCFVNAPYLSKNYWKENKERITDLFIKRINKAFPTITRDISHINAATPHTMARLTSNYRGAAYGWAGTLDQFSVDGLSQTTSIKRLFLSGHWATHAQGISGVVYVGMLTSKLVLNLNNKRKCI